MLLNGCLTLALVTLAHGQKPPFDLGDQTLNVFFNDTLVNPGTILPLNGMLFREHSKFCLYIIH